MISGEPDFLPKSAENFITLKFWHNNITYQNILKHTISMKYHKIHCKYTNITLKLHLLLISWNFYTKRRQKWDTTDTFRQNTASVEQKFTAHLKVLSHHWRWSRWHLECLALDCPALKKPCGLSLKVVVHVTYICVGVLSHPQSSWWGGIKSSNLRLYYKTKTKRESYLSNERGRQVLSFSVLGGWQLVWKF